MQLLEWQTLLFLAPIGLGVLYLLMMAFGALSMGAGGADVGHDVGGEVDVGADADLDHDLAGADFDHGFAGADLHPDLHADLGHAHDTLPNAAPASGGTSFLLTLAGLLGLGKVPLSILMMSYLLVFGGAGLIAVNVLGKERVAGAAAIAIAAAVLVTRQVAGLIARLIPPSETYGTAARGLLGLCGEVLHRVTSDSGTVRVFDPRGDLRDVPARAAPGTPALATGTRVVLSRYVAPPGYFEVRIPAEVRPV